MAENEVELRVKVTSEGVDNLTKIDEMMRKLETTANSSTVGMDPGKVDTATSKMTAMQKTTETAATSTKKQNDNMAVFNTSVTKAVPEMQLLNPLMSAFGLSTLLTAGALGVAALGLGVVVSNLSAAQNGVNAAGAALGQYTDDAVNGVMLTKELTDESAKLGDTTGDVANAYAELVTATHNSAVAKTLLTAVNTAAIATNQSDAKVALQVADAYQGAWEHGKSLAASTATAMGEAQIIGAAGTPLKAQESQIMRSIKRFFDPTNPHGFNFLENIGGNANNSPSTANAQTTAPVQVNVQLDSHTIAKVVIDKINGQVRARNAR